jgi:hypothetical protein
MIATFLKDLRLILRDRSLLFFTLVLPVVVISIFATALLGDAAARGSRSRSSTRTAGRWRNR